MECIQNKDSIREKMMVSQKSEIEEMFLKYHKEWCLLSYRYLENMPEAEDMVQDVFVKILMRKRHNEIINLKSYIGTAVRNTSIKKIKRTKKLEKINDYNLIAAPSYEQEMIDVELKNKAKDAIDLLPEKSKRVFQLCVLHDLKYENAADILGISINTVKFHLKKAFKMLRLHYKNV